MLSRSRHCILSRKKAAETIFRAIYPDWNHFQSHLSWLKVAQFPTPSDPKVHFWTVQVILPLVPQHRIVYACSRVLAPQSRSPLPHCLLHLHNSLGRVMLLDSLCYVVTTLSSGFQKPLLRLQEQINRLLFSPQLMPICKLRFQFIAYLYNHWLFLTVFIFCYWYIFLLN